MVVRRLVVSTLALASACLLSAAAPAQQVTSPPPEIAEKAAFCATCHGQDGVPVVPETPIIFGQHMFYLLTQLRDFRAERRASDIMTPIAKDLSDEEMTALAT
jgi:cytochrome c553